MEAIVEERLKNIERLTKILGEKEKRVKELEGEEYDRREKVKLELAENIIKALKYLGPTVKYTGHNQETLKIEGFEVSLDRPVVNGIYLGFLYNNDVENRESYVYFFLSELGVSLFYLPVENGRLLKASPTCLKSLLVLRLKSLGKEDWEYLLTILVVNTRDHLSELETLWSNIKRFLEEAEVALVENEHRLDLRLGELLKGRRPEPWPEPPTKETKAR